MEHQEEGRHFVLVHGACHGAWCWYKLKPLLESAGHRVTAVDLAASGINLEHALAIETLDDLAKPLLKLMASIPADEKVILVGHSYGGFSIGLAMENHPEKISVAVFLSAYMPDVTHNLQYVKDMEKQTAFVGPVRATNKKITGQNVRSRFLRWLFCLGFGRFSPSTQKLFFFKPEEMKVLYQLSPVEDLELGKLLERPTPELTEDFSNRKFSRKRYGSVKRAYFGSTVPTLTPHFEEWQIRNFPPEEVCVIVGADHMSMISKPHQLCQSLMDVADKYM